MTPFIFIGDRQVTYLRRLDALSNQDGLLLDTFEMDPAGLVGLSSHLDSASNVNLILERTDEYLEMAWCPQLRFWEKPNFIKHKTTNYQAMEAIFSKCIWSDKTRLSNQGRPEQKLISIVQPYSLQLDKILDLLKRKHIQTVGIYSYSFLIYSMLTRQKDQFWRCNKRDLPFKSIDCFVIIEWLSIFEFRQIFVVQGEIEMKRRLRLDKEVSHSKQPFEALIEEIEGGVNFLIRQSKLDSQVVVYWVLLDWIEPATNNENQTMKYDRIQRLWNMTSTCLYAGDPQTLFKCQGAKTPEHLLSVFFSTSTEASFYQNEETQLFAQKSLINKGVIGLNWGLTISFLFLVIMTMTGKVYFFDQMIQSKSALTAVLDATERIEANYDAQAVQLKESLDAEVASKDTQKRLGNYVSTSLKLASEIRHNLQDRAVDFHIDEMSKVLSFFQQVKLEQITFTSEFGLPSTRLNIKASMPEEQSYQQTLNKIDELLASFNASYSFDQAVLANTPIHREVNKVLNVQNLKLTDRQNNQFSTVYFEIDLLAKHEPVVSQVPS